MDTIPQLLASLEHLEFWIDLHFNPDSCLKIRNIRGKFKLRRNLLKRLLRCQLREFKRD